MKQNKINNKFLREVEHLVDRAMPWLLILLALMIVAEFTAWGHRNEEILGFLDSMIVAFFIVDLCFKWHHIRRLKTFVKLYWIDIIAVFPFYIMFRAFYAFREFLTAGEEAQRLLHETVLVRETKLIKEIEMINKARQAARLNRAAKIIRTIARTLRLLRARWYLTFTTYHKRSHQLRK